MAQLTFDPSLRTELSPRSIDFTETTFFRTQTNSPNKPTLPTTAEVRARAGGDNAGVVAFPDLQLFVKFGRSHRVSLEEAQMLQAVHRAFSNEEVPVPEVVAWRAEDEINYIYMSLIPGSTLQSCWPDLSVEEKTRIADQLARMVASLRSVRLAPGTEYIGSLDHGPINAMYFRGQRIGPFPDTATFHDALQFWALPWLPLAQRPPDPYRHLLPDSAEIYFSHGDLHLANIMVDGAPGSIQVSGVVDWGFSGWFPEYWEYYNMVIDTFEHEWCTEGWMGRVFLKSCEEACEALDNYWSWHGPA